MNSRKNRKWAVRLFACLLAATAAGPAIAAGEVARVLIVSDPGARDGGGTTPVLRRILEETGAFEVRVCEVPKAVTMGLLSGFDLVIDNAPGSLAGDDVVAALLEFAESGKGLIVTHAALEASPRSVEFLEVEVAKPDHPITAGLPARFKVADAPAHLTLDHRDEILLAAPGRESVLTVSKQGEGRVIRIALGHDAAALQEATLIRTFARAAQWAATGKVTLPEDGQSRKAKVRPIRGLVITGGHFHEAAFFQLFAGMPELGYLPVEPIDAAKSDLRGKYDVLILYDFTREPDDAMKKNLRDFVEAGKGVVVLHHALLDFQRWDWWCNEVVGGSYRLSSEGGKPSSAVKDAQDFYLTPKEGHPITAGLEPFHLVDEAYRRMRFSDKITPLLTTDNPASDPCVAWVGPGPSYRVAAIQLGHGQTAFRHPSYRTLVHNAILWAAGRTK
ncbi:Trehalose utilization [Aquisphaera giovannonii]|uniref:Trehalose utilization n=1 Tax=Aquisphaera giovannonii TaxID=406548 RepID=A0A5B9VWJ3_9BACT|nr:ThuA domain-containing protein [Aquisphaera giovannonii]QEH32602.1 Trehalose utilization [Aquisphaera giovannonii]